MEDKFELKCDCGVVIEDYEKDDIHWDLDDFGDRTHYVICPVCHNKIYID